MALDPAAELMPIEVYKLKYVPTAKPKAWVAPICANQVEQQVLDSTQLMRV